MASATEHMVQNQKGVYQTVWYHHLQFQFPYMFPRGPKYWVWLWYPKQTIIDQDKSMFKSQYFLLSLNTTTLGFVWPITDGSFVGGKLLCCLAASLLERHTGGVASCEWVCAWVVAGGCPCRTAMRALRRGGTLSSLTTYMPRLSIFSI